ncbi:penicillin-binding protein 1A [Candidatus Palauibacter sp.]|uniref:penicillin-binding protein 1A n=1 Tax=Candidatus Palauibacter sp. TaxID=3101350 RepID=UPI003B5A5623
MMRRRNSRKARRARGGRRGTPRRKKTAPRRKTALRWTIAGWRRLPARVRGGIVVAILGAASFLAGLGWRGWTHLCDACPSIAQIYAFEPKEATKLFAADGSLLAELAIERRTPIRMDDLPRHIYNAFIAVEDKRFWGHAGVDLWRTSKAFVDFLLQGYGAAGGSSITQQLAGNMFQGSVDRRDITVRRKLREMRVAIDLERAYSKTEILEAYLNQINFDGVYGVQAAAERYFGKTAAQLNLPEAALLAAIPRNPAGYNPTRRPERAIGRRNLILALMAEQGLVSPEDAAAAKAYPLELTRGARIRQEAPYFVEWVRQRLQALYGMDIYEKGYRVYTTLDPDLQAVADSALLAQLEWVDRHPAFSGVTFEEVRAWPPDSLYQYQASRDGEMPYVQGMFIALDAATGDVRAMVGGRDFRDSEFNRATQAVRQPGSVFKPFVYTTAIASGIPASEVIYDQPYYLENVGGDPYAPSNFDEDFKGPLTLRRALARSINVVAVKLGQRVGEESFAQMAERMGISSAVPRVPSAAIGSVDLRPIEVATAYTTFANLGVRVSPRSILRIESKEGRVMWESQVQRERVLDPGIAWIAQSMLRDAVDMGTGTLAVRSRYEIPYTVPVGGKTGTTNDATNTWFVGFTPDLVTTTWIGFDRPQRIYRGATGGGTAAPVGAAVLAHYYETHEYPDAWERPEGLIERTVDETTGLLSTRWCPVELSYVEIYLEGTEPTETCDAHGPWTAGSSSRRPVGPPY